MVEKKQAMISVVVPVFNEDQALSGFAKNLIQVLRDITSEYEIIFVDDGSKDETHNELKKLADQSSKIRVLSLSRNFGKEIATTAGINNATGRAIITIDGDGQHPAELIPEFIKLWQAGDMVVIGLRLQNQKEGLLKKLGSWLFYGLFSHLAGFRVTAGATDFRLIDHSVQQKFAQLTERNRITRGLIDWLGYHPKYVEFNATARVGGEPGYSLGKLFKLAIDSAISLSISPLYLSAYVGAVVLPLSVITGLGMVVNAAIGDPLSLHASGGAYVLILVLFLVGILLVSQGIIGLYLSHIHAETQNRPLYVVDESKSIRA